MKWSKKLSKTDAQQPTKGYPVQYLRFTRSRNPQDNQSWFKQTLFAAETWVNSFLDRIRWKNALFWWM